MCSLNINLIFLSIYVFIFSNLVHQIVVLEYNSLLVKIFFVIINKTIDIPAILYQKNAQTQKSQGVNLYKILYCEYQ